jgi:hypothetical protein
MVGIRFLRCLTLVAGFIERVMLWHGRTLSPKLSFREPVDIEQLEEYVFDK